MADILLHDNLDEDHDDVIPGGLKNTLIIPLGIRAFYFACKPIMLPQKQGIQHRHLGNGICSIPSEGKNMRAQLFPAFGHSIQCPLQSEGLIENGKFLL